MESAIYGRCPSCNGVLHAGHTCWPPAHVYGQAFFTPAPLTEADIRRIIREELARATPQPSAGIPVAGHLLAKAVMNKDAVCLRCGLNMWSEPYRPCTTPDSTSGVKS